MLNPPTIINGQLIFLGAITGQVTVQAQPVAGNNLLFNLPNTVPNPNAVISVISVVGSTVTLGFTPPPGEQAFSFSQITGLIATSQLCCTEGNGSLVQLTNGGTAPSPVTTALGTAAAYAILGASAVTNSDGASTIISGGNIGSYPTNTITPGTPSWTLSGGAAVVTAVAQNQTDLATAIAAYQAMGPGTTIGTALDSQVLTPGVYSSLSGTFSISGGVLTLNGAGVYVFLAATTLVLTGASTIVLTGGATAANVVFVCGSSFTAAANSGTIFNGNILAHVSITVDGGTYNGRLLAATGAVTISTATSITAPSSAGVIAAGDVVIYDAFGNIKSSGILISSLGGGGGAVASFNARTGAVVPLVGDYSSFYDATGAATTAQANAEAFATAAIATALASGTYNISITGNAASITGNITPAQITQFGATTGQAIVWNGAEWKPASVGGSSSFSAITSGTNTTATMVVGPGSVLTFGGAGSPPSDGVVDANYLYGVQINSTVPTTGQVLTATSPTAADWQTPSGGVTSVFGSVGVITTLANPTFTGNTTAATVVVTTKLRLNGTVTLLDGTGTAGTSGQVLTSTGTGTLWAAASGFSGSYTGATGVSFTDASTSGILLDEQGTGQILIHGESTGGIQIWASGGSIILRGNVVGTSGGPVVLAGGASITGANVLNLGQTIFSNLGSLSGFTTGSVIYCTDAMGPQDTVLWGTIAAGSGSGSMLVYDGTNWRVH